MPDYDIGGGLRVEGDHHDGTAALWLTFDNGEIYVWLTSAMRRKLLAALTEIDADERLRELAHDGGE